MSAPLPLPDDKTGAKLLPSRENAHAWAVAAVVLGILCQFGVHVPAFAWSLFGVPVVASSVPPTMTPRMMCLDESKRIVECGEHEH